MKFYEEIRSVTYPWVADLTDVPEIIAFKEQGSFPSMVLMPMVCL